MTDLPRRPIRPLPPPPGSFEQTVARARSRRRRALVGASSAGLAVAAVVAIVGATSLGHLGAQREQPAGPVVSSPPASSPPASSAPASSSPASSLPPASPPPSSVPPTSAAPSISVPVLASPPMAPPASPPVAVSSAPPSAPVSAAPAVYRGRLTDGAHHPLKGYDLYWAYPDQLTAAGASQAFTSADLAATTSADGTFQLACRWADQRMVAVLAAPVPVGAESAIYAPINNQPDNEASYVFAGGITIVPTINVPVGCASAGVVSTVIHPHAVVTATLSVNGHRYDATDAARSAAVVAGQPGPGPDLRLQIDLPSPNGEIQLDGVDPDPATGTVVLTGVGSGEVGFGIANQRVAVNVTDGTVVKVAVAVTTGTADDGSDTTVTATVVP